MGKKSNCCKKNSSTICSDYSSSSSCSSIYPSSFTSSSNSCCPKYPKCCCLTNKCAPIYYPNNCVGRYPCPEPCPPFPFPSPCSPIYKSYSSVITGNPISFNLLSQYNTYIVNPTDTSGNLYLPAIGSLSATCYSKVFIISNISSNIITLNPSATTTTTDNINGLPTISIPANSSVNVYSSYISGVGYWCLV